MPPSLLYLWIQLPFEHIEDIPPEKSRRVCATLCLGGLNVSAEYLPFDRKRSMLFIVPSDSILKNTCGRTWLLSLSASFFGAADVMQYHSVLVTRQSQVISCDVLQGGSDEGDDGLQYARYGVAPLAVG